jgi:hypothetical protein
MSVISNEESSKLRTLEVDKKGVLGILKLVPVNNSLFQGVALILEHQEFYSG